MGKGRRAEQASAGVWCFRFLRKVLSQKVTVDWGRFPCMLEAVPGPSPPATECEERNCRNSASLICDVRVRLGKLRSASMGCLDCARLALQPLAAEPAWSLTAGEARRSPYGSWRRCAFFFRTPRLAC